MSTTEASEDEFSLSFVLRTRNSALISRLATAMVLIAIAGLIGLLAWGQVRPWTSQWVPQL